MRVGALIQAHYTDEKFFKKKYNPLKELRKSEVFDEVILCVADIPENRVFIKLAEKYKVSVFFGDAMNITERIHGTMREYKLDIAARVLMHWFYIDVDLIENMTIYCKTTAKNYITVNYDFDMKFGADVFTVEAMRQATIHAPDKFSPWNWMEEQHDGYLYVNTPTYSNKKFYKLRKKILKNCNIAWDYGKQFSYPPYKWVAKRLNKHDICLDISCGYGHGTAILAENCKRATGMDINGEYIEKAIKEYNNIENVMFWLTEPHLIERADRHLSAQYFVFDVVVSIHTMEHVPDDKAFLQEIYRILKPGGLLYLEVPRRMPTPFAYNNEPLVPHTNEVAGHYREYSLDSLTELCEKYFKIEDIFGVARGQYVSIDKARNAYMMVLRKAEYTNWRFM